jgi:hypothetical protein
VTFVTAGAALYLAACFLVAASAKLHDFAEFATTVEQIAPRLAPRAVAMLVVAAECAVAVSIATGLATGSQGWIRVGGALAIGCAGLFAGAIGVALRSGRPVECNCFGGTADAITSRSFAGPVLIAAAGAIAVLGNGRPEEASLWIASASAGAYVLIAHRLLTTGKGAWRSE